MKVGCIIIYCAFNLIFYYARQSFSYRGCYDIFTTAVQSTGEQPNLTNLLGFEVA